jgi:alkanesulfonate monooxygenase SsuD/methylene tetrahydromethanopterin reductase-like flavin-dependent oxidoreductase (luciferase family)
MGVQAIENYNANFDPSIFTEKATTMVASFAAIAETDEKAELLARAFDHWLLMIESGRETPYYLSERHVDSYVYTAQEKQIISQNRRRILVGSAASVKKQVEDLAIKYGTNEIMLLNHVPGRNNRLEAIELIASAFGLN